VAIKARAVLVQDSEQKWAARRRRVWSAIAERRGAATRAVSA